ncbi:hypothetical protein CTZ27_03225 [Streptomyces griseocarneus]|nr:hypothetical protein CTZ27_03225 [Streptomyces griseocarneus]
MTAPIFYGPIGRAVKAVADHTDTDPIGIYVSALTMWSAAISGSVKVVSEGDHRPVLVWSALVGKSSRGKGKAERAARHVVDKALGRFLATHTTSGKSSGASLIDHFWQLQEATEDTEDGRDLRAFFLEKEWSEMLIRAKGDRTGYHGNLRKGWDGDALRNGTKKDPQEVRDPSMVLHAHITPSDWELHITKGGGKKEAGGGTYNRIMPYRLASVPMQRRPKPLPEVDGDPLFHAYKWARSEPRAIALAPEADDLWWVIRRYASILTESLLPENEAIYVERTAEHTLRVAACLAASERSEIITEAMLHAAFTLVRRSVQDAVNLARGTAAKAVRQPKSEFEKVRDRIVFLGGSATTTELAPWAKVSAAMLRSMPGLLWRQEKKPGSGAPSRRFWIEGTPEPAVPDGVTILARKDTLEPVGHKQPLPTTAEPETAPAPVQSEVEPEPEPKKKASKKKPKGKPKKRTTAPQGASRPEARPKKNTPAPAPAKANPAPVSAIPDNPIRFLL